MNLLIMIDVVSGSYSPVVLIARSMVPYDIVFSEQKTIPDNVQYNTIGFSRLKSAIDWKSVEYHCVSRD